MGLAARAYPRLATWRVLPWPGRAFGLHDGQSRPRVTACLKQSL